MGLNVKNVDQYTREMTYNDLFVSVRTSDMYCTVYRNDRPVGTLNRRGVYQRNKPEWGMYATDGKLVAEHNLIGPLLMRLNKHLNA